jgi:GntR family transcriptional repressor for pyruvate dehydrogenase complex
MREVLEGPAAAWAATTATPSDIADLERIFTRLEKESRKDQPNFERLQQLDVAFHLRVASMARNPFLGKTMAVLHEMIASSMQTTLLIPGRLEKSRQDHKDILRALRERSPRAARRAMLIHIRGAQRAAMGRDAERRAHPMGTQRSDQE